MNSNENNVYSLMSEDIDDRMIGQMIKSIEALIIGLKRIKKTWVDEQ
jgi:hypothetical protein